MIIVGITGIIGSGKTTVSSMLKTKGLDVIDLDALVKQIMATDEVVEEIGKAFGGTCIKEGKIDVGALREKALQDRHSLQTLENIIHPKVRRAMWDNINELRKKGKTLCIIDGPLIFETGLHTELDKVVVISARHDTIKERLKTRGMSEEDLVRIMDFQIPLEEKEGLADFVMHNNGTVEDLEKNIEELLWLFKKWEGTADAS